MPAGGGHVIAGVAFATSMLTVFVAVVKLAVSDGVKLTVRLWPAPAASTVSAAGA